MVIAERLSAKCAKYMQNYIKISAISGIITCKGDSTMRNIRPISDLRTKLHEIEEIVKSGEAVVLTKNGRGSMVVMDFNDYYDFHDEIERKLEEADREAAATTVRYTLDEVCERVKANLNDTATVQNKGASSI